MFPRRRATAEQRAFAERVAKTSGDIRVMLVDAATAYVALPRDRQLDNGALEPAWEWVERIAVQWRDAEQAGATHPTVEQDLSSERPHRLLGAIEDSLVLATLGALDDLPLTLSSEEAIGRMAELEEDGAWDGTDIRPRSQEPVGEQEDLAARLDALADATIAVLAEVSTVYRSVAPDGRVLDGDETAEVREGLRRAAVCGRSLDVERALTTELADRRDLYPSLGILRTMQQGLVLTLSADPERRARAIPVPELLERIRPVYEGWKVPSEEGSS